MSPALPRGLAPFRRDNDIDLEPDEFRCDLGISLAASFRPPILDRDVAALDPAEFAQSLHESGNPLALGRKRVAAPKNPMVGSFAGCCAPRRDRPRRRAAEQRDELAPRNHSITSSARASSGSGMTRPRALAVLRLTISSTLVVCWTGRSAGFSPLRTRPVYAPACRYAPRALPA